MGLPYCDCHCCHAMSLLLVMNNSTCVYFCLLSAMNVVMVLETIKIIYYYIAVSSYKCNRLKFKDEEILNEFEGQVLEN